MGVWPTLKPGDRVRLTERGLKLFGRRTHRTRTGALAVERGSPVANERKPGTVLSLHGLGLMVTVAWDGMRARGSQWDRRVLERIDLEGE